MFEQDESLRRYGVTAVENLFIAEYLPAAKGDYVKVYLYALYCAAHPREGFSLTEMADELAMTQSDVEAALRYWERRRLAVRTSESPPRYRLRHAGDMQLSGDRGMEADAAFVAFSEDVYALFGERRKVRPAEIAQAYEWVQDIGLPQEAVLMLLSHCMAKRGVQFSFKAAQAEAVRMRQEGATSAEDAELFLENSQKTLDGARDVLRRLGKRRLPSQDELALYRKWTEEWRFSPDAILAACAETVKGEPTWAYLDGVLNGIRQRGTARTGEQLKRQLSAEQDENAAVRAFAAALGLRGASDMLRATYKRLCAHYDSQVVLLAAREAQKSRGGLDACESMLESWKKRGVADTSQDAARYIQDFRQANQALARVFEACGHAGKPTEGDRALLRKWREWGFDEEMLLLAAQQAVNADNKPPYIDKVLQAWREAGVSSPSQVSARAKAPRKGGARPGKQVGAQQYAQREYSDEELDALTNDLLEEARRQDG